MGSTLALDDLTGRIYDAALDPALWSDAIAHIVAATHCRSGVLYEHDIATHNSTLLGLHRFDPDFKRDYERHYAALDPWNRRVMNWPCGVIAPTYALIPDAEFRRTEFYQDHLRRTGLFYGLGGVVDRQDGRMVVFGVQCGYEDGRFTPEAQDLVGTLMPHLRRAHRLHAATRGIRRDRETLEETLHLLSQPVLVVDLDCHVVFANHAAERLLEEGDGLKLASGRLTAAHRGDRAALAALLHTEPTLAQTVAPTLTPTVAAVTLRRPHRRPPLVARAVPLRRPNRGEWSGRIALLIEATAERPPSVEHLAKAFALTTAEARLWSGLLSGATLTEIAARNRVSINTLRVQLAALFRKAGVHRQADLVRLALELRQPTKECVSV